MIAWSREIGKDQTLATATPYFSHTQQATSLPLSVLIDSDSASSSEIVAGAIQDYRRGWLIGIRTWGKATVQTRQHLDLKTGFYDALSFWRTTQQFYLPSNRNNQLSGILPDIEVYAKPGLQEEDLIFLREENQVAEVLPAQEPDWKQPRQDEIDYIYKNCLQTERAERFYQAKGGIENNADLPLYKAEELMSCGSPTSRP